MTGSRTRPLASAPRLAGELARHARNLAGGAILLVLSALALACASPPSSVAPTQGVVSAPKPTAPAPPTAAPLTKVMILNTSAIEGVAISIGVDKGFFKQRGIDADLRLFASGADASQAFLAGNGDVVNCGEFPSMKLWQNSEGAAVGITPTARDPELIDITVGPEIKSAADLKGKRIGTVLGSTLEYLLLLYLQRNNLKPEDVTLLNMTGADMVSALAKGQIAGFAWAEPFGWEAAKTTPGVHRLATGADVGVLNTMILSTRRSWLEKNQKVAVDTVRALDDANKFVMAKENFNEAVELTANRLKIQPDIAKSLVEGMTRSSSRYDVAFDSDIKNYVEGLAKFMLDRKALARSVDWAKDFDFSVMKAVDPALIKVAVP